jgi:hypothetical protein
MRLQGFYTLFATAFLLSFFIQLLYKGTLLPGPYLEYQRTAVITYGNLERRGEEQEKFIGCVRSIWGSRGGPTDCVY